LRAFFIEGRHLKEIAPPLRLSGIIIALHGLPVSDTSASSGNSPFLFGRQADSLRDQRAPPQASRPETPAIALARALSLTAGRCLRTRVAGLFLFLPWLARLRFDQLVRRAGYPATTMIPAASALLSLLALKLRDKERRSHINDFNFDEAVGLFAGPGRAAQEIGGH
jgi:hypothetical protein